LAIICICEGLEVHAIGFVVGEQQAASLLISLMPPPVPLANGILSRKPLERREAADAQLALNGFEPASITQSPTHAVEIDVRLVQCQVRKVCPQYGEIEHRAAKRHEEIVG
jgi:hypothetical protein